MDSPDVIEQVPAGTGVNKPESGTYGEDVALQRLRQQLPGTPTGETAPPRTQLPPMTGPTGGALPPPPGLPQALFAPTRRPDVPVGTPLQQTAPVPQSPGEQRVMLLDTLSKDPNVSEETREFAQLVLNRIIRTARS